MAQNNKIRTTDLDFNNIKSNLREFLNGQEQFSDYNFEGSALSVLLDVLAYNTHYNALYTNLAVNESFLDSASKRNSVVSKAKELGYVATSARCATAKVKVVLNYNSITPPGTLPVINKYSAFNGISSNTSPLSFVAWDTYIAAYNPADDTYVFNEVVLKQGNLLSNQFEVKGSQNSFLLPNAGIDTSTLTVYVQENAQTSLTEQYHQSNTFVGVDGESKIFFVKEVDNNFYEIEFGNGVVGKQLSQGNIVICTYLVGNTTAANGIKQFTYSDTPPNYSSTVVTTSSAIGGATAEDKDSIRWNAPRTYTAQNRCVTIDDYKTIIASLYPNAKSVNVWGGEDNTPPSYGDIFIAIEPTNGEVLSESEKNYIINDILKPRKIVTMHPKFVDPTYIKVELNTSFYWNPKNSLRTASDISKLVYQSIIDYNDANLRKFGGILKYSALSKVIDEAEQSIVSSISTLKLHRAVKPTFNVATDYIVNLGNPIYYSGVAENSVVTTGIYILNQSQVIYLEDSPSTDGMGTLKAFYFSKAEKTYLKGTYGTVNYKKGIVSINNLVITSNVGPEFKLIIKPQSNDVVSVFNQIVDIPVGLITVSPIIDSTANSYQFTSSRN